MARILFIDDDPLALTVLAKAAEILGHQAILAYTGTEALAAAATQRPDIIFVDQRLPDIDGLTIIRCLRENPAYASTPLIMLSAGNELDAEEAAIAAGARLFIHKPVQLQALQDLVEQYCTPKPQSI